MSECVFGGGAAVRLAGSTFLPLLGDGRACCGGGGASRRWGLAFLALLHRTVALHCLCDSGAFVDLKLVSRRWCLLDAGVAGLVWGL